VKLALKRSRREKSSLEYGAGKLEDTCISRSIICMYNTYHATIVNITQLYHHLSHALKAHGSWSVLYVMSQIFNCRGIRWQVEST
jgi:hypothetical protein